MNEGGGADRAGAQAGPGRRRRPVVGTGIAPCRRLSGVTVIVTSAALRHEKIRRRGLRPAAAYRSLRRCSGSQLPTAAWAAGPRRINLKVWLSAQLEVLAIHFSICQCPGPLASPTESVVRTAAAAGVIVIMWRPGFTLKLP